VLASAPLRAALKYAPSLTAANHGQNPPPVKHVVFYALKGLENSKSKLERTKCQASTKSSMIKQLESGVAPWRKPWTCQTPANLITRKIIPASMFLRSRRRGFPHDSGLLSIRHRSWVKRFATVRNLAPSSSGTLATSKRRPRRTARKRPRGLFCSVITACSICRRRKDRHTRIPSAGDAQQRSHRSV
jgi:hypothetical protein